MAKKKAPARKPTGAAAIGIIDDEQDDMQDDDATTSFESSPAVQAPVERKATKAPRKSKKLESQSGDGMSLGDIRKAATFANSVGGLDKAISLLQILKVAKEVQ